MASKKYTLLVAILVMLQIASSAQTKTDWGWDWKDSSKVPTKSIPQYNEFLNNQFPYPPKPRSAWELGVSLGHSMVVGDRQVFKKNGLGHNYLGGIGVGVSIRKALGHVVSLRGSLLYSRITLPSLPASRFNFTRHTSLLTSVDALFSLNSLSYYRANPKTDIYVLAGVGALAVGLKDLAKNSVLSSEGRSFAVGNYSVMTAFNYGFGASYKLNSKYNVGFERKYTRTINGSDYLDGNKLGNDNDFMSYTTIKLNINLGIKK